MWAILISIGHFLSMTIFGELIHTCEKINHRILATNCHITWGWASNGEIVEFTTLLTGIAVQYFQSHFFRVFNVLILVFHPILLTKCLWITGSTVIEGYICSFERKQGSFKRVRGLREEEVEEKLFIYSDKQLT